jgi:predicted TIM-barrel fold metal-dependent hydrolase
MIIDMHVHLSKELPYEEWASKQWPNSGAFHHKAEVFLKKMDNTVPKIDRALIFGFRAMCSEKPEIMIEDNDYIAQTVSRYPERYIGSGIIDPSWDEKAISELARLRKLGFKVIKVKFASVHMPANCPLAQKIFRTIDDMGMLAVLHSDWSHWTNPSIIADLARRFPDTKIVLQHFGLSQSCEAIEVLKNNTNMYVDTSALIQPRNILNFLDKIGSDRIMYASDTIRSHERTMPQEEINRVLNLKIKSDVLEKIMGINAYRLLNSVGVKI